MRSEYEQRLRDLESERLTAEHDKAKARHMTMVPAVSCGRGSSAGLLNKAADAATGCSTTILCMACLATGYMSLRRRVMLSSAQMIACSCPCERCISAGVMRMRMQVDRYKALLVKQRDIMIALTARLNERDDSILGLQEELEAYDAHQKCALQPYSQSHDSRAGTLTHSKNGHCNGASGPGCHQSGVAREWLYMPCNDLCPKRCAGLRLGDSKQLHRRNVHASGCEAQAARGHAGHAHLGANRAAQGGRGAQRGVARQVCAAGARARRLGHRRRQWVRMLS